jgi:hypothetical protein
VLLDIYIAEPSDARFQGRATRDDQPVPSAMAERPSDESVIARFASKVADRVYKPIPGASFGDPLAFASRQTATRRTENILEVLSSRPKLRSLQLSRIAIKTKGTILFYRLFRRYRDRSQGQPPLTATRLRPIPAARIHHDGREETQPTWFCENSAIGTN